MHEKNCECLDCTDFLYNSSVYGFKMDEFGTLPSELQIKLKKLMSRIMERAYRRGVQQAITLYKTGEIPDSILDDLHGYRYDNDINESIGLLGDKSSSVARLQMEESLEQVGIY